MLQHLMSSYDDEKPVAWTKLPLLQRLLRQFEYVMMIDADAVILRMDIGLQKAFETMQRENTSVSFLFLCHCILILISCYLLCDDVMPAWTSYISVPFYLFLCRRGGHAAKKNKTLFLFSILEFWKLLIFF